MYKIPANTLFLGKNLVYVPQCHSTNTLAAELSQRADIHEGTVVVTNDQTAGRGQRGNSWESAPGRNLTFSLILRPKFLKAKDQFLLNQVVSLGIADYVRQTINAEVRIKWPNDILVEEKKICGILIENHLHGSDIGDSIVGIGLNVNQPFFQFPKACSLHAITGLIYELQDELPVLLGCLEARYLALKRGMADVIAENYLEILYRLDEVHRFSSEDQEWNGTILGVDGVGRLRMKVLDEERVFEVKDVVFL